ncbi:hypothetical protein PanWU01x14_013780 [Parasponia andersonii]|uniref:Uncharacterized protein n=1 Tax=Parasponia andersonii TaxID=3476 RepID=A0A2P5E161_PARAD|nr:hypothetical protein PanWU01x14_013780 [Parasponia andersonii]
MNRLEQKVGRNSIPYVLKQLEVVFIFGVVTRDGFVTLSRQEGEEENGRKKGTGVGEYKS